MKSHGTFQLFMNRERIFEQIKSLRPQDASSCPVEAGTISRGSEAKWESHHWHRIGQVTAGCQSEIRKIRSHRQRGKVGGAWLYLSISFKRPQLNMCSFVF